MPASISITNTTRASVPRAPFVRIAQKVLGTRYDISIVFIADSRARTLNKKFRKKNTPANVLSFPLDERTGEIFVNVARARREAAREGIPLFHYLQYLFIHGSLHLKGYRHSATMDKAEKQLCKQLRITYPYS